MAKKKELRREKLKKKEKKIQFNSNFWIGMFILVTMVLSIAGFAMISGGPNAGVKYKKQQDVPLQYFDKYGLWATVKNNQQFVFKDINQYNNMSNIEDLSNVIKTKDYLNIYVAPNFDPSSELLFSKALNALNINYNKITNIKCNNDTILLLNQNNNNNITGDCLRFIGINDQEYNQTNALVYYLVR